MTDERLLQEAIARCVSIMVFYHNCERTRDSLARARSEIRGIARQFPTLGLTHHEIERTVTDAVREEMVTRFGHEVGPRLSDQFAEAFEDSVGEPVLSKVGASRA